MDNAAYIIKKGRKEIINGKVVLMSPARLNHVRVTGKINAIFEFYLQGKPCEVFADGAKVFFAKDNQFCPDMTVVCDPEKVGEGRITGAPDLVVEVLSRSTSNNDRLHKKKVYEKYGVREYWIVEIKNHSVEVYVLRDGVFVLDHTYTTYPALPIKNAEEAEKTVFQAKGFYSTIFPDLYISLDFVFDRVQGK